MESRKCEYCNKDFNIRDNRQIGRFCSSLCNRKLLRINQLKKHNEYLKQETEEQKLQWLKDHYEKFVIKKKYECWDWNGTKTKGYGNFNHRGKIMKAHRASWVINFGPIPIGTFVLHKCDNTSCSNPEHLFLGNQSDNMQDMISKKRNSITSKNQYTVTQLTNDQVEEIIHLFSKGVSKSRLSRDFKVSRKKIMNLVKS